MRIIYSFFLYLMVPFILVRLVWRSRHAPLYRQRWRERFGYTNIPPEYLHCILIHAVSVGESQVGATLVHGLQQQYPHLPIVVTTMTPTGSERIQTLLSDSVFHVYLPYDLPGAVKRFLRKIQPRLIVLVETELWPNLIHYSHVSHIPVFLANARLSAKSARGYARFKYLTRNMLTQLSKIAAQSEADAGRFKELGAVAKQIEVTGSIKFDMTYPASVKEAGELLRQQLGAHRPVWIAASTRDGEEEKILTAFSQVKAIIPDCLLLLVPRHPERFKLVTSLCWSRHFNVIQRSRGDKVSEKTDIFMGDTMGELSLFYAAADVAFVGGSLLPLGGQNILEPASFGIPVLAGEYLFNFAEAKRLLVEADAITIVHNEKELAAGVIQLLTDIELRLRVGERAEAVVKNNRGALGKHLKIIQVLLEENVIMK